jgi:CARDB
VGGPQQRLAATGARFFSELYVDGSLKTSWFTDPPLNPNFYTYVEDFSIGSLPVGIHTLRIKTDSTNVIAESNETDNEYTKTIAVSASSGPACTPGPSALCLNNSRFKVQVAWRVPSQGSSGAGSAVGLWSRRPDLNRRPAVYETAALPTELRRPCPPTDPRSWERKTWRMKTDLTERDRVRQRGRIAIRGRGGTRETGARGGIEGTTASGASLRMKRPPAPSMLLIRMLPLGRKG